MKMFQTVMDVTTLHTLLVTIKMNNVSKTRMMFSLDLLTKVFLYQMDWKEFTVLA
jgi:hypothetical protein